MPIFFSKQEKQIQDVNNKMADFGVPDYVSQLAPYAKI